MKKNLDPRVVNDAARVALNVYRGAIADGVPTRQNRLLDGYYESQLEVECAAAAASARLGESLPITKIRIRFGEVERT